MSSVPFDSSRTSQPEACWGPDQRFGPKQNNYSFDINEVDHEIASSSGINIV